jgi:hypothetical protein
MTSSGIKDYLEREGIFCEIQTSNVTRYEERCLQLIQQVWNSQKPSETHTGIAKAQWFAIGDDDTIWFMNNLLKTLQQYNSADTIYLGDMSDRTISITRHGRYYAYGGGGVILSRPLASLFARHTHECKRFTHMYGGDEMIGKCITEVVKVNLTRNRNFHQMDHSGDMTGYMESGIDGIVTLHHIFSFWHPFTDKHTSDHNETMHLLELTYKIFGESFLKRYVRVNYRTNQTLLLTNGYSFSLFNRILTPAELIQVEKTWCCTEMVDRETRPKETNKTTWYFRGQTIETLNGLVRHKIAYENKKGTCIGIPILEVTSTT